MRTYFKDFVRSTGLPITVEYAYAGGSETTYSPMSGACGGDPCEVEIVASWPNTPDFDRLCEISNRLLYSKSSLWSLPSDMIALWFVGILIWWWKRRARLTDAERELMEAKIAEDPPELDDDGSYLDSEE